MLSCCALLLFIGGVVAMSSTPHSYEQVLASAVEVYNQQQKPEFLFRLLESEPQTGWDTSGKTTQPIKFSIKETTCQSAEKKDVSQCDYKSDGVDKDCSGFYSTEQSPPTIIVQCENVDQTMDRITRGRFWRKVKNFVKQHGVNIALAAARLG